jgi:hypothetical protein
MKSATNEAVERQHKSLLIAASVALKAFLMSIVATQEFCGSASPQALFFNCFGGAGYVAGSVTAVVMMGSIFGYYIVRIKSFDSIFVNMMKADFLVTAMYFAAAFIAPAMFSEKTMVWLFGIWIFGMLLAPFDSKRLFLKRLIGYGSVVALGIILVAHLVPQFASFNSSYVIGMVIASILAVFGGGRQK